MNAPLTDSSLRALQQHTRLLEWVANAAQAVAPLWPLATFAARSPWLGLEHQTFDQVARQSGTPMYPSLPHLRSACSRGEIDSAILQERLQVWLDAFGWPAHEASGMRYVQALVRQDLDRETGQHASDAPAAETMQRWAELAGVTPPSQAALMRSKSLPAANHADDRARLDAACITWCKLFVAGSGAAWPLAHQQHGLYAAFRAGVQHDPALPNAVKQRLRALPEQALSALDLALQQWWSLQQNGQPGMQQDMAMQCTAYLQQHLCALPGWVGILRWQGQQQEDEAGPVIDYLALRLSLWHAMQPEISAPPAHDKTLPALLCMAGVMQISPEYWASQPSGWQQQHLGLALAFDPTARQRVLLEAQEWTYRRRLQQQLQAPTPAKLPPACAQLVFCIDVRSEPLRLALEQAGPFATFGYAGFFGLPIRTRELASEHTHDACPVIARATVEIAEHASDAQVNHYRRVQQQSMLRSHSHQHSKQHALSSLSLPELTGPWHYARMAWHGLAPAGWRQWWQEQHPAAGRWLAQSFGLHGARHKPATGLTLDRVAPGVAHGIAHKTGHPAENKPARGQGARAAPVPDAGPASPLPVGWTLDQQITQAAQSLRGIGMIRDFAPLVVIVGHASHSRNNPYAAKLQCGACGGAAGGFNARALAALCNRAAVRVGLARLGIAIPAHTRFLAAEHITSQDRLRWLDPLPEDGPAASSCATLCAALPDAMARVQEQRLARLPSLPGMPPLRSRSGQTNIASTGADPAWQRSDDWSEVRPEWALANNAAFIVASPGFTRGHDLQGRCFLHSYQWQQDDDGSLLANIVAGPVTVGQWINLQYYASSVAPHCHGSGHKATQTITAGRGVMQGNGSDLLPGLPWQAVMRDDHTPHHTPQRLLLVIEAPQRMIERLLADSANLAQKLKHEWLYLISHDPETNTWKDWQ